MKPRLRNTKKLKPRNARTSARKPSIVDLQKQLDLRTRERDEALEQQTATSEVLQVISGSPGDLQTVFQAMLANATRLCEANFGNLLLYEGDTFRNVAMLNAPPAFAELRRREPVLRPDPRTALGRVARTKQVAQIVDIKAEQAYVEGDPVFVAMADLGGARTLLAVPMLKDNELTGAIVIYRQEMRPFTEKQIDLVRSFASQAVIAIENTRLLNELRESLQQQTATSEVLCVISSSPGELEPVFQTMLEKATQLCEAKFGNLCLCEGDNFRIVAQHFPPSTHAEWWQRGAVIILRDNPGIPLARMAETKAIFDAKLRTVMSSIMRRRNGLMHLSVMGYSCLNRGC
jgi:transcriptional regulator with GAF, ATPase, and Fis domain